MFVNDTDFKEDTADLPPKAGFYFKNTVYESISKALISKIQENHGILVFTGDTGAGKTFLLHEIESNLGSRVRFVYLKVRSENFDDIIDSLCDELKLERSNKSFLDKMQLLNNFRHTAKGSDLHIVLIIDDAHKLGPRTLASLLLVATPHSEGHAGFQLLFSGWPELEDTMHQFDADDPKRYDLFFYRLEPKKESIEKSIEDRLPPAAEIPEKEAPFLINTPSSSKKRLKIRVSIPSRISQLENLPYELDDAEQKVFKQQGKTSFRSIIGWKVVLVLAAFIALCYSIFLKDPAVIITTPNAVIASAVSSSRKAANAITLFISKTLPDTKILSNPAADRLPDGPGIPVDQKGAGTTYQSLAVTNPALSNAGSIAREFIHKLENSENPIDLELIYREAEILSQKNLVADAYLLYFYAARSGDGNAAFQLAQLADPATFKPHLSMMDAPDPIQANKWYLQAVRNGYPEASHKIEQFHFRLAAQAADGDEKAQRIMLLLQK